jgi:glycine cleavage system H protein
LSTAAPQLWSFPSRQQPPLALQPVQHKILYRLLPLHWEFFSVYFAKTGSFSTHRPQAHDSTLRKTKTPMFRRKNAEPNCCKGGRMFFPEELLYNEDHVWIEEETGHATIGITEYLQDEMEQILSVEMPEIGTEIELGDTLATIELPQGVMEIYSPLSGEVLEINQDLVDSPEWLNSSPYEDGWIIRVKMTETEELEDLMDADDYTEFVQG